MTTENDKIENMSLESKFGSLDTYIKEETLPVYLKKVFLPLKQKGFEEGPVIIQIDSVSESLCSTESKLSRRKPQPQKPTPILNFRSIGER